MMRHRRVLSLLLSMLLAAQLLPTAASAQGPVTRASTTDPSPDPNYDDPYNELKPDVPEHDENVCFIVFAPDNGEDSNYIVRVMRGEEHILPDCMFSVPDGKIFAGWSINGQTYSPGDVFSVHEHTAVLAVWQNSGEGWDKRIEDAIDLIQKYVDGMTPEEKGDPDAIDLAVLYAEVVCMQAATKEMDGQEIELSETSLADLAEVSEKACTAAEATLISGGVIPARELFRTVAVASRYDDITVDLTEDVISSGVDKVYVKTPEFDISFRTAYIQDDLGDEPGRSGGRRTMKVGVKNVGSRGNPKVKVDMPGGAMKNPIGLSFPSTGKDAEHHVVQSQDKKTVVSKRNPITNTVKGKVNASGTYSRQTVQKDFSDIGKQSKEMQSAIRYLASHGVIDGTTSTTFSPDASISRAEIAKLLVTSLGKLSPQATANFKDVTKKNWYYSAAASSQKNGLIKGFEDNTFRGTASINKVQIVAVASRVLTNEMKYKAPSNVSAYLEKYSDGVAKWAQPEVALATKERLVVLRSDGTFAGNKSMTRGDAAIVMYRMFQRIW